MVADLLLDFSGSQRCTSAWCDHIWDRRREGEPERNRERAAVYAARKALRSDADEPASMRRA